MLKPAVLRALAQCFLGGEQDAEQVIVRASETLGRPWRWLRPVATRYIRFFAGRARPRRQDVIAFLLRDPSFERAAAKYSHKLKVARWITEPQQMQPVYAAQDWDVPSIRSPIELARWLGTEPGELEWFADLKGLSYKKNREPLRHYRYRVLSKRSGGFRLIEAPKPRLKQLQRRILAGILDRIPPHPAAHGFVPGRSIRTFAAPHAGRRVVLRMDLLDFFPSFPAARIQALFRTMGYPESVADLFAGICTNAAPRDVWNKRAPVVNPRLMMDARALYARPHLPQGAPTSPSLANACAYRIDCRLSGLARAYGAAYTRYADDLAFSGDERFESRLQRFSARAAAILIEEGFTVNHRKTRIMRQGVRQHLAGLVVNRSVNVDRAGFDLLKAILTNCARSGPEDQNREGHANFREHLEGRVSFVESINPHKGRRLRAILERIQWK